MRPKMAPCSPPLPCPAPAGELVVIDVNFFPSFKGVPEAPQALRQALLAAYAAARPAT